MPIGMVFTDARYQGAAKAQDKGFEDEARRRQEHAAPMLATMTCADCGVACRVSVLHDPTMFCYKVKVSCPSCHGTETRTTPEEFMADSGGKAVLDGVFHPPKKLL